VCWTLWYCHFSYGYELWLLFKFLGDCSDDGILISYSLYYIKQDCIGTIISFCRLILLQSKFANNEVIRLETLEESSHLDEKYHIKLTASALAPSVLPPCWQSNEEASSYCKDVTWSFKRPKFSNLVNIPHQQQTFLFLLLHYFPFVLFANVLMNIRAMFRCLPLEA
jgi:hypothetical protein